jgi:hypothetical protein
MRTFGRLPLLLIVALTFSSSVAGKCPTGSVTVQGRIENLASGVAAEVAVVVETPKGNVSKTASISNGEFSIEMPFSTWSSSFLWGDRCHNVPTIVETRVLAAGKVCARKRIAFKHSFEMYSPSLYRLKQNLIIDVLKEAGTNAK